jgi:hypothetical protein
LIPVNDTTSSDTTSSETTEEVKGITYATISIMAVSAMAGALVSVLRLSSPQSFYFIVNQLQLLMLLPLTGAFIPKDIIDFLVGMSFSNFNFDFISVDKIPIFSHISEKLGHDHDNEYLKDIGVESGSTLVNNLSLIFIYILLAFCHLL